MLSLIIGFVEKICFFGLVLGVAGCLLWLLNSLTKRNAEEELKATQAIMVQWRERLFSLGC